MRLPSNRKPALANEIGILFDSKKKNQEALSDHAKSKAHLNVIASTENGKETTVKFCKR